jgi:predicted metal-dependent phosphoesterase TrpH
VDETIVRTSDEEGLFREVCRIVAEEGGDLVFVEVKARRSAAFGTPAEAVGLILKADGLPALAHPLTSGDAEGTIIELKAAGLVGVEVYYAGYSSDEINTLLGLAHKCGLIATGGTDYHGPPVPGCPKR